MKDKHKDVLMDKAVVKDRAKADALLSSEHSSTCASSVNPWVYY